MKWYIKVLQQFDDFNGRARRKEYWMFALFNTLFLIVIILLEIVLERVLGIHLKVLGFSPLSKLYYLVTFVPVLAVTVRRLHDVGKSGWMCLIIFIPLIGFIWIFVLTVSAGNPGENQYGQNPKEVTVENEE